MPPEALEHILKTAERIEPYRLEVLLSKNHENTIIIQGDRYGLKWLVEAINGVIASPELDPGTHYHFDIPSGLTKADFDLIIQYVEVGNDFVAHS